MTVKLMHLISTLWLDILLPIFVLSVSHVCNGLVNVSLLISPLPAQRGDAVRLLCEYDLQDATLYSVKWYRGAYEFYRYLPTEKPSIKIFPFPGINVDVSKSNANLVVLQQIGFNLSGNLTCEVTTDSPEFTTAAATQHMLVIDVPKGDSPTIMVEKSNYSIGDRMLANCSSRPSRPAANLFFYINNIPVNKEQEARMEVILGAEWLWSSNLLVDLILLPSHFDDEWWRRRHKFEYGYNISKISLVCTAVIDTFYRNSTELSVIFTRQPKTEKVTSSTRNTAIIKKKICIWWLTTAAIIIIHNIVS